MMHIFSSHLDLDRKQIQSEISLKIIMKWMPTAIKEITPNIITTPRRKTESRVFPVLRELQTTLFGQLAGSGSRDPAWLRPTLGTTERGARWAFPTVDFHAQSQCPVLPKETNIAGNMQGIGRRNGKIRVSSPIPNCD